MQHQTECILCYENTEVIGLLPCNHRPMCYTCVMKLVDGGFYFCPICKAASKIMLFTDNLTQDYEILINNRTTIQGDTNPNHFFTNRIVKSHVERESMFICAFATCKVQYPSLNILKKHLNEVHKRQFCDLCLDNRRCLLSQQRLFSEPELNSHLADGEIEETGVVSLYHPFCEFCRSRYYDQDTFLKHLKTHEQCFICNKRQQYKYVYYKDYKMLEIHFDTSHYMCKHNNCLDRKFTNVFATEELRDFHYAEMHLGQNFSKKARRNIECMELTGFYQAEIEEAEDKPMDGMGRNFEKELISVSRKMQLNNQVHENGPIDIRELYVDKCLQTKHMSITDIVNQVGNISYLMTHGHPLTLECIHFFKPMVMKSLPRNMLNSLIDDLYVYQLSNQIKRLFFDGMSDIKSFEQYCHQLTMIIENGNPMLFFYIFPQLIRFFKDTNERKKFMDNYYLKRLRQLPQETVTFLHSCWTYEEFIEKFKEAIETNVSQRIVKNKIDLSQYTKSLKGQNNPKDKDIFFVGRDKMKNLYHMVEKIRTCDLLKLNWLLKVGISIDTHNHITKIIYFSPPEQCVGLLDRLTNTELAMVYCYFRMIEESLKNKERFKFEKSKEDVNILRDLLIRSKEKYAKVKGINEIITFQEGKRSEFVKKTVAPKEVVIKISEADLPSLPTSDRQQEQTKTKNKSSVQMGFLNTNIPNMKKWDEEKRAQKRREEEMMKKEMEQNAARAKVLDMMSKKKKQNQDKDANMGMRNGQNQKKIQVDQIQEPTSPPRAERATQTPKPPPVQLKRTVVSEADQIQLAIEESKKSFEYERRKRKQQEDQQQQRMQCEISKQIRLSQTKKVKEMEQKLNKTINSSAKKEEDRKNKSKNVFELLEFQEEQIRMKNQVKSKHQPAQKQPIPEKMTMKTLQKDNPSNHNSAMMDHEDFPTLNKSCILQTNKNKPNKNKQIEVMKKDKEMIPSQEFPTLGKSTQQSSSWIDQVNGRPKQPQAQQVKVRKKKGRTTIEQTIDIFNKH